jgi:hypothetical protein
MPTTSQNRRVSPRPGESAHASPLSRAAKRAESRTKLRVSTRFMIASLGSNRCAPLGRSRRASSLISRSVKGLPFLSTVGKVIVAPRCSSKRRFSSFRRPTSISRYDARLRLRPLCPDEGFNKPARVSCGQRRAWPASGVIRGSDSRLASCSLRSTAGSPRALTRSI